ncbi:MAG: transcription termination/antitermination protein NusG [Veillonellaceae bacterium]|uniref:transcription termination/antitermination protein NusG n=1 Tax=Anaerovibrio lipolyticus TaxID=82374 RepID=UPI001F280FD3|nr:transcription termination/antitermination protein NusG [Anaerovibrio lipolyticus]MCI7078951.1 transcription termination/antitermination protein NusG [Veillonellaceae bacterium]MDY4484675.1 transcription termination/antitermination protein NusG [Anaerovibrio sp.]MCF2600785.1 transcription termination/antitermination protein NusG [Anaerovibrio lipolyticus]MCI7234526.1 transcription termination/antitermination protein NusG [Veillonellaceae bacterium]MCI7267188.1 transcription termination/antit
MGSEKESARHWYVVHTYSGYENKVLESLKQKVQSMGLENEIFDVIIPEKEEVEKKDGVEKVIKRKIFPGYVLVNMIVNEKTWYDVRNTDGVTGFVGSGTKPIPLTEDEYENILREMGVEKTKVVHDIDVEVGETVKICSGPFENFAAKVVSVDDEKGKIKALVDMFGRETNVELDFDQVEKN